MKIIRGLTPNDELTKLYITKENSNFKFVGYVLVDDTKHIIDFMDDMFYKKVYTFKNKCLYKKTFLISDYVFENLKKTDF
jgi:hypothetical protein